MAWRDNLLPASFRGATFHVDGTNRQGGRRNVGHQFPKRDEPYAEDMGRRGRRISVTAYVIGDDYTAERDALEAAMEKGNKGLLVLPTRQPETLVADTFTSVESRTRGGMAEFELVFLEPGDDTQPMSTPSTAAAVEGAASKVEESSSAGVDKAMPSSPEAVSV